MRELKNKATILLIILMNINMFSQKCFISFEKIKVENILDKVVWSHKIPGLELELLKSKRAIISDSPLYLLTH